MVHMPQQGLSRNKPRPFFLLQFDDYRFDCCSHIRPTSVDKTVEEVPWVNMRLSDLKNDCVTNVSRSASNCLQIRTAQLEMNMKISSIV